MMSKSKGKKKAGPQKNIDYDQQKKFSDNEEEIPKIDMNRLSPNMYQKDASNQQESSGKSGRPLSNREVDQTGDTIFKINAEEWNNIPKIVFEAIAKIVMDFDTNLKRQSSKFDEINRTFKDFRQNVSNIESNLQNDILSQKHEIENQKKQNIEKQKKMIEDTNEKISRVQGHVTSLEYSIKDCSNQLNKSNQTMDGFVKKQNVTTEQSNQNVTALKVQIQDLSDSLSNLNFIVKNNFDFYEITGQEEKNENDEDYNQRDQDSDGVPRFRSFIDLMKFIYKVPMERIDQNFFKSTQKVSEARKQMKQEMNQSEEKLLALIKQQQTDILKIQESYQISINNLDERFKKKLLKMQKIMNGEDDIDSSDQANSTVFENNMIISNLVQDESLTGQNINSSILSPKGKFTPKLSIKNTVSQLEEQLAIMKNELKNQNLKFAQQIERMNGDIQTKDDRIRKVFEDQGINISFYEDNNVEQQQNQRSNSNQSSYKNDQQKPHGPKLGRLNEAQVKQVEQLIAIKLAKNNTKMQQQKGEGKDSHSPFQKGSPNNSGYLNSQQPPGGNSSNRSQGNVQEVQIVNKIKGNSNVEYQAEQSGINLQKTALKQYLENKKLEKERKQRKLVVKKVEVNRETKEFKEFQSDEEQNLKGLGEVRKYVQNLREQQNQIQINSRKTRKDSFIQISGHATGSYFYPHDQISNGGALLHFGSVSAHESPKKSNQDSNEKNKNKFNFEESLKKFHMPDIANLHLKGKNDTYYKNIQENDDRSSTQNVTINSNLSKRKNIFNVKKSSGLTQIGHFIKDFSNPNVEELNRIIQNQEKIKTGLNFDRQKNSRQLREKNFTQLQKNDGLGVGIQPLGINFDGINIQKLNGIKRLENYIQ